MKIATLTYEEALNQYPKEVYACLTQLRNSRRKNKNADPTTLKWHLEMCVAVPTAPFGELLDNALNPPPALSLDDQVAEYMSCTMTSLCGAGYSEPVPTPAFVATDHRAYIEKTERETAAFALLPNDEKERQIQDLLDQLPGVRRFLVSRQ